MLCLFLAYMHFVFCWLQIHADHPLSSHLGPTSLVMQWTVVGLAFFNGLTVCLAAFALLFGVLALLLSWPILARECQPLWQSL